MKALLFLTILIFSTINLYATVLDEDTFESSSDDGWSRDDGQSSYLQINKDKSSSKTFSLGASYANAEVSINFYVILYQDWESSDRFRIEVEGDQTNYYGTNSDAIYLNETVTATTDSSGDLSIEFSTNTNKSGERAYIDYVTIEYTSTVPTITAATYSIYNTAPVNTVVGDINSTGSPDTFTILSGDIDSIFSVSSAGEITIADATNLENNTTGSYSLEINASNSSGYDVEFFTIDLTDDIELSSDDVNTRDFTNVSISGQDSVTINGSILQIGNQLLCKNDSDGDTCVEPSGANLQNNYHTQHKAKIDTSAGAPSSNTMAKLVMEDGDEVVLARLYWSARVEDITSTQKDDAKTLQLKGPNDSAYTSFTSKNSKYNWHKSGSIFDYVASADVTEYVQEQGAGEYYAGGIEATNGSGMYASWQLIVVVENPSRSLKNVSIYDGFYSVYSGSGYPDSAEANATGFITPSGSEAFNANLFIYMGESDDGFADSVEILNDGGDVDTASDWTSLVDGANTSTDVVNASIYSADYNDSYRYNEPDLADPNLINVLGVDIDKLAINVESDSSQQILSNSQTSTVIRISSNGDRFSLNMFAFETEVFVPEFCYDYAYSQNDQYFTEDNDGTNSPELTGDVTVGSEIEISIFIKSLVDSSLSVSNMSVDISDINTTQATYIDSTTRVALTGELEASTVSVTSGTTGTTGYIHNIDIGDLAENDYFYIFYKLDPLLSTMDMPLSIEASYDLDVNGTEISYKLKLSEDIPLCTYNNFNYVPAAGIFNVVHNDYSNASLSSGYYYNLPTQVTKREGNFKVLSMDDDDYDVLMGRETVAVAIELIDVSAFHYTDASCKKLESSISDRVWVVFENNATVIDFDKDAIQSAIDEGMTDITSTSEFYANARSNAAFRMTYNSSDDNGSVIVLDPVDDNGETKYNVLNFPDLSGNCSQDMDDNVNSTDKVVQYCNNAGGAAASAMTKAELKICMECIYGYDTRFICSRDNFSIRPEAFLLKLNDQDQTTASSQLRLSDDVSGVSTPSATVTKLAADYNYVVEINATNFLDSTSSSGYTKSFSTGSTDEIEYEWSPTTTLTGCNDTNSSNISTTILNGEGETNTSLAQVGEYTLHMEDTTWTAVDNDADYMTHHTGSYFISSSTMDCSSGSSTQAVNSTTLNGCDISSNHDGVASNLSYRDYSLEFHPYEFNIASLTPSVGINNDIVTSTSYVYMADMSQDENMSLHLNSTIQALGYGGTQLSNFVGSCFSKPLNLEVTKSDTTLADSNGNEVLFQSRLHNLDSNGSIITADNIDTNETDHSTPLLMQTDETHFTKDLSGAMNTLLNINYNRETNSSANPIAISYTNYSIECTDEAADCTFNANLGTKTANADLNITSTTINHYYGRTNSPRSRFTSNTNQRAFIYYEVFCNGAGCDKSLLQNGTSSIYKDDPRWFVNTLHNSGFGDAGTVTQKGTSSLVTVDTPPSGNHQDSVFITYDNSAKGNPYKTTMENNASSWLIYNKFDGNDNTNEFEVEFEGANSTWAGQNETNTTTNRSATEKVNRRSMW